MAAIFMNGVQTAVLYVKKGIVSKEMALIGAIALSVIALLSLALSLWASVKMATLYGASSFVVSGSSKAALSLWVIGFGAGAGALLLIYRFILLIARRPPNQLPNPHEPSELQEPSETEELSHTIQSENGVLVTTHTIIATMPGRYTPLVNEGDTVHPGTPLFIIDAMKMESLTRADRLGTVALLISETGAHITQGQPILHIRENELV